MTGQLFGGRYQLGETLGFGGMSEVHRGRDFRLTCDVAIKVLRADLARDPSFQMRFGREAQNAASLNHPAIVAVYDTGETDREGGTVPYIVMEYVDGETLRDLLKREGSLAPARAMKIAAEVCAALDFSHRHGIVHRDIKPANVMLTAGGAVKVMDFGIARAVADGQASLTGTATVMGTARYLSPEQARGGAVDARSDVYATGCVLFELLVGAPPFTGDSPVAVAYRHVREDPKAPSEVKPGLPRELDSIVLKALNKNPMNRYQTAAEMGADLVRALSGQAVHATPLMNDDERTQLISATAGRVDLAVGLGPALLEPPRRRMVDDDIWDDEKPGRSKKVWGFLAVGVLCLALLAGAILFTLRVVSTKQSVAQVLAPQVQELSVLKAEQAIRNIGLSVGSIRPVENSAPTGSVIRQDPSPGTLIDTGRPVNLEVSKGISRRVVPNLATLSGDAAQAQLNKLGLVAKVTQQPSTDAQRNTVLAGQRPAAGVSVNPGTPVGYSVGSGPVYTKIPVDLAGKSYDQAVAELKTFKLTATQKLVDGVQPKNTVLKLDGRKPGDSVQQGTPITLQVSSENLFITPNLANLSPEDAYQQLHNAGWAGPSSDAIVKAAAESTDRSLIGKIAAGSQQVSNGAGGTTAQAGQVPVVGQTVAKTARIDVVVWSAKQVAVPSFTPEGTLFPDILSRIAAAGFDPDAVTYLVVNPARPPHVPHSFISLTGAKASDVVPFDTPITITIWGDAPKPPPPPPTTTKPPTSSSTPTAPTGPPVATAPSITPPTRQNPQGGA